MKACDFSFYVFYFILNTTTIISLCTFAENFFTRFSIFFLISFFGCLIISYYLFLTVKRDPGKMSKKKIEIRVNTETTMDSSITAVETLGITKAVNEELNEETSDKFCQVCMVSIPLRGKHCTRCGVCIRKFDHHCFMVGGCVGEKNHLKFYIYLLTQTITLFLAIIAILDTVSYYLDKNGEKYSKVPIILYFLLVILLGYCLMTTILLLFHSYLILTNQTTNEIYHRVNLPYLAQYRDLKKLKMENLNIKIRGSMPFHPFDRGFKENLAMVFYGNRQYDWAKIYIENLNSTKIKFNFCENEYWSCF